MKYWIFLFSISTEAIAGNCVDIFSTTKATIQYYDLTAKQYSEQTLKMDADPDSPLAKNQEAFLSYLIPGDLILDAGAGSGRDTLKFLNRGFNVKAIDASAMLAAQATVNTGHPVRVLRFENLNYSNRFEGIWAMASLIHVKRQDFKKVMRRFSRALKIGGYFFLTLRYGTEDLTLQDGRYFNAFTEKSFSDLIESMPGLEVVFMQAPERVWRDGVKQRSLEILLHKIPFE